MAFAAAIDDGVSTVGGAIALSFSTDFLSSGPAAGLSSTMVTGPSLHSCTSILAPNRPCCTGPLCIDITFCTKRSQNGRASCGPMARWKLQKSVIRGAHG